MQMQLQAPSLVPVYTTPLQELYRQCNAQINKHAVLRPRATQIQAFFFGLSAFLFCRISTATGNKTPRHQKGSCEGFMPTDTSVTSQIQYPNVLLSMRLKFNLQSSSSGTHTAIFPFQLFPQFNPAHAQSTTSQLSSQP